MHKIDGPGHLNGSFVDEDAYSGRAPTLVTPEWLNAVQGELVSVVVSAGIPLDKSDATQLARAIQSGKLFSAAAAGTADAITAAFTPDITVLRDGMALYVRGALANATTAPTFTPKAGTVAAKAIVKGAGAALAAGDIAGVGHWIELQYDMTLDKWVLLNPATGVAPVSGLAAGAVSAFAQSTAPTGWLKANGAAISRTTYAALFAAIGTTFGVGDGSTTFNVPDLRGQFIRGWVDNGTVDSGRAFGSTQTDALQNITGSLSGLCGSGVAGVGAMFGTTNGPAGSAATQNAGNYLANLAFSAANSPGARTSTETRPTNVAFLACIKF
jgi:microcystin-dependent protein